MLFPILASAAELALPDVPATLFPRVRSITRQTLTSAAAAELALPDVP